MVERRKITRVTRHTIDSHEIGNLDEAPEEYRKLLEDKDGDGIPDVVQGQGQGVLKKEVKVSYEFNGRKYGSLDEMPLEHRALFADRDGDGIPDAFGKLGLPATAFEDNAAFHRSEPAELQIPLLNLSFRENGGSGAVKFIGIILCVLILVLVGVLVFLYGG